MDGPARHVDQLGALVVGWGVESEPLPSPLGIVMQYAASTGTSRLPEIRIIGIVVEGQLVVKRDTALERAAQLACRK